MEITKTYIEDWLEKFLSENPSADSFELAMAAMQHGYNKGFGDCDDEHKENMFYHPERFCENDFMPASEKEDSIVNEWFEEADFPTLEILLGEKYTDFDEDDGYAEFVEAAEHHWYDVMTRDERISFYKKMTGFYDKDGRLVHDTVFGTVKIVDDLMYILYDDEAYYTLPPDVVTDEQVRQFCVELKEFEE